MKLLLVEDSARLRATLEQGLRKAGYAVDTAKDGREGLWLATENEYDVIVLDLMLPEIDGLTVLRKLREQGKSTHVLILSAKDLVEDRIQGLRHGADDYLVKPFSFDELCARIEALVRRSYRAKNPVIHIGPLEINTAARRVAYAGREVKLTPREYSLLEILALRAGEVVSRGELWERLYEFDSEAASNVVDVLVYSLRKKLDPDDPQSLIKTRRGQGYLIERVRRHEIPPRPPDPLAAPRHGPAPGRRRAAARPGHQLAPAPRVRRRADRRRRSPCRRPPSRRTAGSGWSSPPRSMPEFEPGEKPDYFQLWLGRARSSRARRRWEPATSRAGAAPAGRPRLADLTLPDGRPGRQVEISYPPADRAGRRVHASPPPPAAPPSPWWSPTAARISTPSSPRCT